MKFKNWYSALFVLTALFCALPVRADVPELAKIKAAAEAGDPAAQFAFAKTFMVSSGEWTGWMMAAAAQGYGPAEDELAWTPNWNLFSTEFPTAQMRASHLRSKHSRMQQALLYAGSAAEKGFGRSQLLLGLAYARGYLVPLDRVEAYTWMTLSRTSDIMAITVKSSLKNELLKSMSLDEVKKGEARALNYHLGGTAQRLRYSLIIPSLKLTGLASNGADRFALVNGARFVAGQTTELNIDGLSVRIRCLRVEEKTVVVSLPPDRREIALQIGAAPVLLP